MDKAKLLDEVFLVGIKCNYENNKTLQKQLFDYLKLGPDLQVYDAVRMVRIFNEQIESNDYESGRGLAMPIFNRLTRISDWDFTDLRILACVVAFAGPYEEVVRLCERILRKLSAHAFKDGYDITTLTARIGVLNRLLRAKYFEQDGMDESGEITAIFDEYANAALKICEESADLGPQHAAVLIKQGLFLQKHSMVDEGFNMLTNLGDIHLYKALQNDARDYNYFVRRKLDNEKFNAILGQNLHNERNALNLNVTELGKILEMGEDAVRAMENGESTMSAYNLFCLAFALAIPADNFFKDMPAGEEISNFRKRQLRKLETLANMLDDKELAEVIHTMSVFLEKSSNGGAGTLHGC